MTRPGLQNFLDGGEPRASTIRKLQDWHVRWFTAGGDATHVETAVAALSILTRDLPTGLRNRSAAELVGLMERHYAAAGIPRPSWLKRLRIEVVEHTVP